MYKANGRFWKNLEKLPEDVQANELRQLKL